MEPAPLWLCLACLLSAAAALDDFYFSRHPQNLVVREGDSVDLECMVSNTSFIRFYWQLDGRTVLNSSRRFQRGSDLHITRVDRSQDSGHFTCIAMNVTTGFSLTSLAASLTIQWLDRTAEVVLQSPEQPAVIRPGADVTLRCRVDGSGELAFQWYRNGERLARAPPRLALRNKRLVISGVRASDGGAYSCSASNAAGMAHSNASLPLVIYSPDSARLVQAPQDLLVRAGTAASFDCRYDAADSVRWEYGRQQPIANNGRYSVLANSSLLVRSAGPEDEGWYHCVGLRSGQDTPQRYSAQLRLAYLEPLTAASVEPAPSVQGVHVTAEGRPMQLTCLAPAGLPPPVLTWRGPDGDDVTDRSQPQPEGTAVLSLDSAQVNAAGNYSCEAENIAGRSVLPVQILVATPPELISGPVDLVVDEGARTELTCQFRGLQHPFTTVSWLKDGRPVRSGQVFSGNGSLVMPLTELSDGGRYKCVINSTGFPDPYRSSAALLTVKEKLKFSPRPVSRGLELGKPGRLYCRASGSTPPTVRWVKLDRDGRPVFDWPAHVQDNNGTLVFSPVTESDGGQYSCVATNPQGFINATINVAIIVTPKFVVTPKNPTEAVAGRPLLLECQAYGRPEPSVQWDKNSRLNDLDETRFTKLDNGSLYISELQMADTGRYGCIAGNSGGFSRQEIQLIVRGSEAELTGRMLTPGLAADDGTMMTRTVAITVSAAAAYLLLVAGLMLWCRYRRLRRKQQYLRTSAEGTSVLLAKPERAEVLVGAGSSAGGSHRYVDYPRPEEPRGAGAGAGSVVSSARLSPSRLSSGRLSPARYNSYQSIRSESSSQPSRQSRGSAERRAVERRDLQPVMPLGQGEFGDVYLARVRGREEPDGAADAIVMVKSLLEARDEAALSEFAREAELYGRLTPHAAVARLLALLQDAEPHLMVLEYSDWGDLKQFLLATRADSPRGPPRPPPISPQHAYSICFQLAAGLEHIHAQRFVHRDVAARNCLITSSLDAKLSCGRLSRDTYGGEYCLLRGQRLPLRWLAPEAAAEDEFSSRADCWAWAVLSWEVLRQGELPHAELGDDELLRRLTAGQLDRLAVPAEAPRALCETMLRCWQQSPRDRPDMSDVVARLAAPHEQSDP